MDGIKILIQTAHLFHSGIDLLARDNTLLLMNCRFYSKGSYGNLIVINHDGGRQNPLCSYGGALNVRAGRQVNNVGDIIGTVGTGRRDIDKPICILIHTIHPRMVADRGESYWRKPASQR